MIKPGLNRSIPGAILGFAVGALIVMALRAAQGLQPFEPGVVLVLTPFTTMAGWLWGIGAFNPKWSEHGDEDHADTHATETAIVVAEDAHEVEEPSPLEYLFSTMWTVTTYVLLVFLAFYTIAALPLGLYLQTTGDPAAAAAAFAPEVTWSLPAIGEFQTSQLTLLLAFVAFTMVSLLLTAGVIAFLFVQAHQQVAEVEQIEPASDGGSGGMKLVPGFVGRASKRLARSIREDLPRTLGGQ